MKLTKHELLRVINEVLNEFAVPLGTDEEECEGVDSEYCDQLRNEKKLAAKIALQNLKRKQKGRIKEAEESINYGSPEWGEAYRDGMGAGKETRKDPEVMELLQSQRQVYKLEDRVQQEDILGILADALREINLAVIDAAIEGKSPTYISGFKMGYKMIWSSLEGAVVPKHQEWGQAHARVSKSGPAWGMPPDPDLET